ncbi:MAG: response regulator [Campylobacterota bacterium]|nr:response regulator [Campylobacterota bacterium]
MKNLKNKNLLFLEDNLQFAKTTVKLLELYFQDVIHCSTIQDALDIYENQDIDLIISDLKVDDGIALDFLKEIRETNLEIPLVVLSGFKDEKFLLEAMPLGLTSYEIKPISFERFGILLNKISYRFERYCNDIIIIKENIFYNKNKKVIIKNNQEIQLSKKEAMFVELLIKNKNRITTKDEVSQYVWDDEQMSESALKNLLLRIRKKVDKDIFKTLSKIGYKL